MSHETFAACSGQGFAPWEIHRPQQAVRELLTQGAFQGSVLDCGSGIGDNALFVAKFTDCTVDAVDLIERCTSFAKMKAGLRNMRPCVGFHTFDLLEWDASPLAAKSGTYDVVLDSCLLHAFDAAAKQRYLQGVVHKALKQGGMVHVLALSDQDTNTGGPVRLSRKDLTDLFCEAAGWQLVSLVPHHINLHPTFWGGRAKAYLLAARKL